MEFGEKLQQLRKNRSLTQEELASGLNVSRAAVSKWESGRGYPSIDSLKDISVYFSVSVDDLLSGDKLILIAEKEKKADIKKLGDLIISVADIFSFLLIILPLYPDNVEGVVHSVNLFGFEQHSRISRLFCLILFVLLVFAGIFKLISIKLRAEKINTILTGVSVSLNIFAVLFLALTRVPYALIVAFLILVVKGAVMIKRIK